MRRLKLGLVIVAAVSLVIASAAVARHKHGKTHTDPVATGLNASLASIKNKTCTGEDGAYRQFHGKWTGSANINVASDPRLKGTLKVYARGLINTSPPASGQVTGSLAIRGTQSSAKARFWAVYSGAGQLNGFVNGWVRDRTGSTTPENQVGSGRLLGTLTGTLTNGSFTGQIGAGGTAPVGAANIQGGGCRNWHDKKGKGR